MPIIPPMGRTGRRAAGKQAYSMSAVDEYGPVIDDIYDFAEAQGFEIDGILQEGGAGAGRDQPAARRPGRPGRRDLLFQAPDPRGGAAPRLLRHLHGQTDRGRAGQRDAYPSFGDRHGHRAQHLLRRQGRRDGGVPSLHRRHADHLPARDRGAGALCEQLSPLCPDFAAPINLEWGRDNRTTGIRVPISDPQARRIENRLAGMDCNPYLGLAASLACGYLG
jgi:glutamine synthetase